MSCFAFWSTLRARHPDITVCVSCPTRVHPTPCYCPMRLSSHPPIQLSFNVFAFFKENALYSVPPILKSFGKGNWILVRQLIRHLWPQHSAIRWGRSANPLTNSISTRVRSPWLHVLAPRMAGEEYTHLPTRFSYHPHLSLRIAVYLYFSRTISVNSSRQSIHELIIFTESHF